MMSRFGFTLLEVLIAMFIMAMLTVGVSASIRTAVKNKQKLEARMESQTMLYDTIRILKQDIERAFHYQDVFYEIENLALQQMQLAATGGGTGGTPASGVAQTRPPPFKFTQFMGTANSMNFTTLNHFRTKYNAQESDQMEVGYSLANCKSPDGKSTSDCLWRRANTQIDDEVDLGGNKVVIARNVTKFKLSYRSDKEHDEWVSEWRSDNRGRLDHQNKFPTLIKVELEIEDKDDKKVAPVKQTFVARVFFPNNEPHIQQQQQQQLQQPGFSGVPQ